MDKSTSRSLYLFFFPEYDAYKIGVTNSLSTRASKLSKDFAKIDKEQSYAVKGLSKSMADELEDQVKEKFDRETNGIPNNPGFTEFFSKNKISSILDHLKITMARLGLNSKQYKIIQGLYLEVMKGEIRKKKDISDLMNEVCNQDFVIVEKLTAIKRAYVHLVRRQSRFRFAKIESLDSFSLALKIKLPNRLGSYLKSSEFFENFLVKSTRLNYERVEWVSWVSGSYKVVKNQDGWHEVHIFLESPQCKSELHRAFQREVTDLYQALPSISLAELRASGYSSDC